MDVVVLLFPREEHAAAGLRVERGVGATYRVGGALYAYCELSSAGWKVGEKPPNITSNPLVVPLPPSSSFMLPVEMGFEA